MVDSLMTKGFLQMPSDMWKMLALWVRFPFGPPFFKDLHNEIFSSTGQELIDVLEGQGYTVKSRDEDEEGKRLEEEIHKLKVDFILWVGSDKTESEVNKFLERRMKKFFLDTIDAYIV
jgi:hypothetical protein